MDIAILTSVVASLDIATMVMHSVALAARTSTVIATAQPHPPVALSPLAMPPAPSDALDYLPQVEDYIEDIRCDLI